MSKIFSKEVVRGDPGEETILFEAYFLPEGGLVVRKTIFGTAVEEYYGDYDQEFAIELDLASLKLLASYLPVQKDGRDKDKGITGAVLKILEGASDPFIEFQSVLRKHKIPFNPSVF